jgi:hypothetical protein
MRLLALLLLACSFAARAEDASLMTIRTLLAPMRADQTHGRKARGATLALTEVKHRLRDWVESRLSVLHWNGNRWNPDPRVLQEQLNNELDDAGLLCEAWSRTPCPDWTQLGFLGRLVISIDRAVLIVRATVGIDVCGDDESAYAYEWNEEGAKWRRFWASEQNEYEDGKYFPERFRSVQVSAPDFRPGADRSERLILTLGTEPWCTSNWHDVYSRVWQTRSTYSEPKLLLNEKEWAYVESPIEGSVSSTDVAFEYDVPGAEGGTTRREIRHYALRNGRLERTDPVALTPREFTSYWLESPVAEISRLTDENRLLTLTQWRSQHQGAFWDFTEPTRHCTQRRDLWQVGTSERENGKQEVYFLVRWRPPYHFTMVSVSDRPQPDCTEIDREADLPRSLFPGH